VRAIAFSANVAEYLLKLQAQMKLLPTINPRRNHMNAKAEFSVIEEQVVEVTQEPHQIELSLSDLDLVGGGTGIVLFG
jgi:hypothetical protein